MMEWLRRQFWPVELKIQEFLDSDLGWVRFLFILGSGAILMVLAIMIQFFFDPESGQGWLTSEPILQFVPTSLLRFTGVVFSPRSLRFLLLPIITFVIAMIVGARYVQDIYNLTSYRLSFRYLFASLFGQFYPYLRIENGEMVLDQDEVNPLAVIGGPGYVMINPGNAVLFEHLRHPAAVHGQGLHFVSRFESIKEIIDLRDQQGLIEQSSAMSKDGLIVTIHEIRFRYRVAGVWRTSGNTGRSIENPYPFSVQAIRNLVYSRLMRKEGVNSWSDSIRSAFEGDILNYIRTNLLDTVTAPDGIGKDPRKKIRLALSTKEARAKFKNLGAELLWFDIGRFNFEDPAVEEQRISTWAADFVGDAEVVRAFGEAQRKTFQELARAEAQAEIVMSLVYSLRESGIADDLKGEAMHKLVLMKTAQVIEAMSSTYESNPNGA
jgi:hypothetical protein